MAKTKRRRKGVGSYFRKVFTENPEWLDLKSNDQVQARYEADHPGKAFTTQIRGNMANIKSVMRKEIREGGRKPGRRAKAAVNTGTHNLLSLELAIDNCLSTARDMDPKRLEAVINHLRLARNALVWKMGEH